MALLCRKVHNEIRNLTTLANNNYALPVARLTKEKKHLQSLLQQDKDSLLESTESLSSLKTQLGEMKTLRQTNLSHAIEMRKEISSYLSLVLDSVKNTEKEIVGQIEENDRFLTDLVSLYEEGNRKTSDESSREASNVSDLLELQSLVNSCQVMCCPDDTEETIKAKISESVEQSREKFMLSSGKVNELRKWKRARFAFQAYDSDSVHPLFNSSLKIDWTAAPFSLKDLNLLLLSHLICYVIKPSAAANSQDLSDPSDPADAGRFSTEDDDSDFSFEADRNSESTDSSSEDSSSSNLSELLSYISRLNYSYDGDSD
jgi:hypothetical protein